MDEKSKRQGKGTLSDKAGKKRNKKKSKGPMGLRQPEYHSHYWGLRSRRKKKERGGKITLDHRTNLNKLRKTEIISSVTF